jgi:preprotein translocase subunit Sec61beta
MIKIKKPTGLIRYGSENELNGVKRKTITPRSIVYAAISLLFVLAFVLFLNKSADLQVLFLRGGETFTYIDQTVTNRFTVKFNHQGGADYKVFLKIKDPVLEKEIKVITPVSPINLASFEKKVIVFFKFPPTILVSGTKKVNIDIVDQNSHEILATKEVVLVGPTH